MRITRSVWLCILFHTLSNATAGTFYEYSDSLIGHIVSTALLIVVSVALVLVYGKKNGSFVKQEELISRQARLRH